MTNKTSSATNETKGGNVRRMPRTLAGNKQPTEDAKRTSLLGLYDHAVRLMHAGKYEKAHEAFSQMLAEATPDLADRVRMYIAACVAQIDKGTTSFQSHEERFDYAISLLNHGHYDDAHKHFKAILLENTTADYAFYGLAVMASLTEKTDDCIQHLGEAIRLNSRNRLLARSDPDFEAMTDDPRFTELLYPEN